MEGWIPTLSEAILDHGFAFAWFMVVVIVIDWLRPAIWIMVACIHSFLCFHYWCQLVFSQSVCYVSWFASPIGSGKYERFARKSYSSNLRSEYHTRRHPGSLIAGIEILRGRAVETVFCQKLQFCRGKKKKEEKKKGRIYILGDPIPKTTQKQPKLAMREMEHMKS